jgi:hypothetical protein
MDRCSSASSLLVYRLLVVRAEVNAMKHRALVVTNEENIWWVRLNGVEVVSFVGPHAEQWAYREREELAQLLDAQLDPDEDEQRHESVPHALFAERRDIKAHNL